MPIVILPFTPEVPFTRKLQFRRSSRTDWTNARWSASRRNYNICSTVL